SGYIISQCDCCCDFTKMAIHVLLLTLCTGLCVADLKENIALNARVVQSSLYNNGVAEHAVDGNRDTDYGKGSCTHTNAEFNPWWRADLGNVYSISRVAITNRGDCCKEKLRGAQIRIGNNLENDGNNNELVATVLTVHDGTKTFEFEPVNGRYVNIFLPGNDEILTLCEVEVFAEKDIPLYTCGPIDSCAGSCSVTNADKDPWWRVDILDVYRVTRVIITNRGDCCERRIEGIQIRIGNSLENNGNNNELAATVGPIPLGDTKTFEFKPIKGRCVNIFLPGRNEYLTLCEVEVYAGNLAVDGATTQSSTFEGWFAEKATDSNRGLQQVNTSCSSTLNETNPWWRLDLRDVYRINKVVVTNRNDCCAERMNGTEIHIGNSLENNGNNNPICAVIPAIPAGESYSYSCGEMEGRYVNMIIPGNVKMLTLCEVEVYGQGPVLKRSFVKMQFNSKVDLTDPSVRENVLKQLGSVLAVRGFTNVTLRWSQTPKREIQKVNAGKSESVLIIVQ
ncbi:hypothetical protein QQF64_031070, partial [Cirrhinus molitorella]